MSHDNICSWRMMAQILLEFESFKDSTVVSYSSILILVHRYLYATIIN